MLFFQWSFFSHEADFCFLLVSDVGDTASMEVCIIIIISSDVTPLSGISGPSFDSPFLSPHLFSLPSHLAFSVLSFFY